VRVFCLFLLQTAVRFVVASSVTDNRSTTFPLWVRLREFAPNSTSSRKREQFGLPRDRIVFTVSNPLYSTYK